MWQFNHCPHCGNPIVPPTSDLIDQLRVDSLPSMDCAHCGEPIDLTSFLKEAPLIEDDATQVSEADLEESQAPTQDVLPTALTETVDLAEDIGSGGDLGAFEQHWPATLESEAFESESLESERTEEESDELASEGGPAIVFSLDEDPSELEFESDEPTSVNEAVAETFNDGPEGLKPSQLGLELDSNEYVEEVPSHEVNKAEDTKRLVEPIYADEENWAYENYASEHPHSEQPLEFNSEEEEVGELNPFGVAGSDENDSNWQILQSATRRPRRPEPSAFRKIVPPILGGLAAFPIATAIMWYGFGKDIGTTGQVVAEYVPWIVPSKFHKNRWEASIPPSTKRNSTESPAKRGSLPKIDPNINIPNRSNENRNDLLEPLTPSNAQNPNEEKPSNETKVESTTIASAKPTVTEIIESSEMESQPKPKPVQEPMQTEVATVPLSVLIADMRKMQDAFFSAPKDQRLALIKSYYQTAQKLSEESSKLKGRSASVWRRELESLAKEILAVEGYRLTFERCASGKIVSIPAAKANEFVTTVMKIGENNNPLDNDTWLLQEKWPLGESKITVEMLPLALRTSTSLPATVLVLGKLVEDESASELKLQIHLALSIN